MCWHAHVLILIFCIPFGTCLQVGASIFYRLPSCVIAGSLLLFIAGSWVLSIGVVIGSQARARPGAWHPNVTRAWLGLNKDESREACHTR